MSHRDIGSFLDVLPFTARYVLYFLILLSFVFPAVSVGGFAVYLGKKVTDLVMIVTYK